jgi:hypothetical protein
MACRASLEGRAGDGGERWISLIACINEACMENPCFIQFKYWAIHSPSLKIHEEA